jgi:hypothetical protein
MRPIPFGNKIDPIGRMKEEDKKMEGGGWKLGKKRQNVEEHQQQHKTPQPKVIGLEEEGRGGGGEGIMICGRMSSKGERNRKVRRRKYGTTKWTMDEEEGRRGKAAVLMMTKWHPPSCCKAKESQIGERMGEMSAEHTTLTSED